MKGIIKQAERLIEKSNHPYYHMSAILIKSGNILSTGVNKVGPKPFYVPEGLGTISRHAEIDCLHFVDRRTSNNATLLIYGKSAAGNKIKTRPCQSCMSQIKKMGIKEIIYQEASGELIREKI